jgi:hypothetical protein
MFQVDCRTGHDVSFRSRTDHPKASASGAIFATRECINSTGAKAAADGTGTSFGNQ